MSMIFLTILGGFVLLVLWGIAIYNRLVRLKNQVKNSWSQIDVQLQRRYDLIPNLVEAVKGYMGHERSTLEAVTQARNIAARERERVEQGGGPTDESISKLLGAEKSLGSAVSGLFAVVESYPQLKANENMLQLQEELKSTENKVAFARQAYNDTVMEYNTAQMEFPAVVIARAFGHTPTELFEVEEEKVRKGVKISFST